MPTKIDLLTRDDTYHGLCELADTKKQKVKIDRQALSELLIDHSRMAAAIKGSTSFQLVVKRRTRERI